MFLNKAPRIAFAPFGQIRLALCFAMNSSRLKEAFSPLPGHVEVGTIIVDRLRVLSRGPLFVLAVGNANASAMVLKAISISSVTS
jgi:hypothetical protein